MTDQMNVKGNDDGNPAGTDSQPPKNARDSIGGGYADDLASYGIGYSDGQEEGYGRGWNDGAQNESIHAGFRSLGARPGRRNLVVWTWRAAAVGCCLATALAPTVITQILGTVLAGISLIVSEVAVIGRALEAANLLELERQDGRIETSGEEFPEPFVHADAETAEIIRKAVEQAIEDGAIAGIGSVAETVGQRELREMIEAGGMVDTSKWPERAGVHVRNLDAAFRAKEDADVCKPIFPDLRPRFYTTGDRDKAIEAILDPFFGSGCAPFMSTEVPAMVDRVAEALGLERAL